MNIIEYIKNSNLPKFGGDCGMFALHLKEKYGGSLAFLTETKADEEELVLEAPIYHVLLKLNDKFYDGDGEITEDKMIEFCHIEYGDSFPALWTDLGEEQELKIVRWNTAFTIDLGLKLTM